MSDSNVYRLGYDVLGPVFASFARLLLSQAERDGVTRLAFVARDGEFLRDVTARLIRRLELSAPPALDYVYFSRVSTILSQYSRFRDAVLAESDAIFGARRTDVASFLGYFGIDAHDLRPLLERQHLSPTTELRSIDQLSLLLDDPALVTAIESEGSRQKALLADYLDQIAFSSDGGTAMVDIGWRGSIQAALANTFPDRLRHGPLRGYYLGYWDEHGRPPGSHCAVTGILSDWRRGRTLREGSAYYAAYVLEAVCRAPHGTVLGYTRDHSGAVVPVLAGDSPHRDVERAGEQWREPIRRGISDFIDAHGDRYRQGSSDTRRDAQKRLFRLAFFPTGKELDAAAHLAHTEGHAPAWSRLLIDPARPSLLRSPRRWMAGLASPWRSGYVMATGGRPLALAFAAVESLLLTFPSIRRVARRLALKLARS